MTDVRRSEHRRPQWRGPRTAVMVRLPFMVGEQLRAEALYRGQSLSDTAGALIAQGLDQRRELG